MSKSIVKHQRAVVRFGGEVSVDGYRMPDGSFRVGITTASIVAGFSSEYLRRALSGTRSKPLRELGFEGQVQVLARETERGEREERTISTKDFLKFLRFADRQGKLEAGAILDALAESSLNDFFRDAFGDRPLSIDEKREQFCKAMATRIDWRAEDKEEALALIAWR